MSSTREPLAYSVEDAAEMIGIGRTMAFALIRQGDLRSIKVGHRRLVVRADLEDFIERLRASELDTAS